MHFVEIFVDDAAQRALLVIVGHLATCCAHATHAGAHAWAGAAKVETDLVKRVEGFLRVFRGRALEHDVPGLAVKRDQARAVFLPDIADFAHDVGVVVESGWRHHAQRVEFLRLGEFFSHFRKTRNNTAAISVDADDAALPETQLFFIGVLKLAEQIVHHRRILLVLRVAQSLQSGDEARPWSAFKFVQHGRGMLFCLLG